MNTTRALTLFLAPMLLGFIFLALSAPTARAADPVILRVTTSGTTGPACGDASNWSNPCTLDTALTKAAYGDELWVAAGTYTPTIGVIRTATFQLKPGVALYGGFAGGETLRTQRNFTANVTILSGDLNGNDNSNVRYDEPTRDENAYHVVTGSGVTNTAVLDGFTVTGGNANASTVDATSTPSLSDSVVQGGCPAGSSTCTNIITADPRLGELGNWGGATKTVPLLPGSSAIDAGNDATCAATDQRGVPRPQGAHCDIGAYEGQLTLMQLNLRLIRR